MKFSVFGRMSSKQFLPGIGIVKPGLQELDLTEEQVERIKVKHGNLVTFLAKGKKKSPVDIEKEEEPEPDESNEDNSEGNSDDVQETRKEKKRRLKEEAKAAALAEEESDATPDATDGFIDEQPVDEQPVDEQPVDATTADDGF